MKTRDRHTAKNTTHLERILVSARHTLVITGSQPNLSGSSNLLRARRRLSQKLGEALGVPQNQAR